MENFVAVDLPWTSYDPSKKYGWKRLFASDFRESLSRLNPVCSGAVGLDQRGDIRSVILLYLAGCREVISTSNYMGADVFMPWWAARRVETPSSEHQWQIAEKTTPPPRNRGQIWTSDHRCETRFFLKQDRVAPRRSVGGGRLWADDRWKELIVRLRALDCELIGICGPSQTAAAALSLGDVPVKEVVSIEEWKRVLSEVKIAITLDSGPMHLANAMGFRWSPCSARDCCLAGRRMVSMRELSIITTILSSRLSTKSWKIFRMGGNGCLESPLMKSSENSSLSTSNSMSKPQELVLFENRLLSSRQRKSGFPRR